MKFDNYFKEFCDKYNYTGKIEYDKAKNENSIVISKDGDNAGLFLSKEELMGLSNRQIENLLNMLHIGFIDQFHK
ncbi:hypothetical protein QA584_17400 [Anaerocolumna sp. AGMB13025]|uniref:hypothetical protein n=1 Tax=Anaerocolumna sp. AGMB13025 TaxID=3039116 RepID=UPI00241F71F8|nr:hypothetical protein [Anaerocolumna sp. AGMB13025]WFR55377.1 hypothetical protein QA584_17400 [Anaerocolumna sp. AGMB13025]